MNKILIVDASDSDRRLMSGLLTRSEYEPIVAEDMEAAKQEMTKLSPGAVIISFQYSKPGQHCLLFGIPNKIAKSEVLFGITNKNC